MSDQDGGRDFVLGVDLDGVCADFYERMREIAAIWFEKNLNELPKEVSWGLGEWGLGDDEERYKSLHRFAMTQHNLFLTVPMIQGARKYLRMLSNEGVRIRIITHRLFIRHFHVMAIEQTTAWLDTHGIPYWDLCFMRDKGAVGADLYIEDSPGNIKALRAAGHETICFANSTNVGVADPRVKTWAEVYHLVHEYMDKASAQRA